MKAEYDLVDLWEPELLETCAVVEDGFEFEYSLGREGFPKNLRPCIFECRSGGNVQSSEKCGR